MFTIINDERVDLTQDGKVKMWVGYHIQTKVCIGSWGKPLDGNAFEWEEIEVSREAFIILKQLFTERLNELGVKHD
jgi:hypothetical protein